MRSRIPHGVFWLASLAACGGDKGSGSTGLASSTGGTGADGGEETGEGSGGTSASSTSTGTTGGTSTSGSGSSSGTSTGTGSSTGGTTSSSSSSGSSFVVMPDGGATGNECDTYVQDCPDGLKCMPWANDGGNAWNATKCTMIDPSPRAPGDECTATGGGLSGVDNCQLGSMCWNVDGATGLGTCLDLCTGTPTAPTCPSMDRVCVIFNDGTLPVCLATCDPLISDCADREVCRPEGADRFVCSNDASGVEGQYGDPCEYGNACDPGLFCANVDNVPGCTGSSGCCSEFCDLEAADPAADCSGVAMGQECLPWYAPGSELPGWEHVGYCGIPT